MELTNRLMNTVSTMMDIGNILYTMFAVCVAVIVVVTVGYLTYVLSKQFIVIPLMILLAKKKELSRLEQIKQSFERGDFGFHATGEAEIVPAVKAVREQCNFVAPDYQAMTLKKACELVKSWKRPINPNKIQHQGSLTDQMTILYNEAIKLGCYDAAKAIKLKFL